MAVVLPPDGRQRGASISVDPTEISLSLTRHEGAPFYSSGKIPGFSGCFASAADEVGCSLPQDRHTDPGCERPSWRLPLGCLPDPIRPSAPLPVSETIYRTPPLTIKTDSGSSTRGGGVVPEHGSRGLAELRWLARCAWAVFFRCRWQSALPFFLSPFFLTFMWSPCLFSFI